MNPFDAALGLVTLLSILAGAFRGFVREAAALAGWILAVILVLSASRKLGLRLPFDPGSNEARTVIAAILIVLACTLGASLVGRLLRAALTAAKLGGPDRALGALFGAVRAGAIAVLTAAVVMHTGLAQRAFWMSSRTAPWLEAALRFASPGFVPPLERRAPAAGA